MSLRLASLIKKKTPTVAAAHLRRWAILLAMHQYDILYRPGKKLTNADALSRLPLQHLTHVKPITSINSLNCSNEMLLRIEDVQKHTREDTVLSTVLKYVVNGFLESVRVYKTKNESLSSERECVLIIWPNFCAEKAKSQGASVFAWKSCMNGQNENARSPMEKLIIDKYCQIVLVHSTYATSLNEKLLNIFFCLRSSVGNSLGQWTTVSKIPLQEFFRKLFNWKKIHTDIESWAIQKMELNSTLLTKVLKSKEVLKKSKQAQKSNYQRFRSIKNMKVV